MRFDVCFAGNNCGCSPWKPGELVLVVLFVKSEISCGDALLLDQLQQKMKPVNPTTIPGNPIAGQMDTRPNSGLRIGNTTTGTSSF